MQKTPFILVTVLVAGLVCAQEQSESVAGILNELAGYQGVEAAPAVDAAPVVEVAPAVEETLPPADLPAADPMPMMEEETIQTTDMDIPAVIEESRELYAGGEFEMAQAGFASVVKVAPENLVARMYLRKILERDSRTAEIGGMKAVAAAWNTSLVLRSYPISADAAEKMELGEVDSAVDVSAKFPEADFPKGASAVYQPRMEKIFVRNTAENLTIIEEILDAMDVAKISEDVEQVEIEAKFIEISEGTLEELGFEWRTLAGNTYDIASDVTLEGGQYLFDDALRTVPFAKPNSLGAGSLAAAAYSDTQWSALRFENTFNDAADTLIINSSDSGSPLDLVISALDQSTGADVLSAPRIVTKSGEEAVIRVGEKHLFPEVYEPSASGGNIVHVKYEDWEEKLLGVELTVTPQVDGDQIEMELAPKITELQGWQTYDIAEANSAYTWYQYRIGLKFTHDAIKARLPIFRIRNIETEITIADGATIGMGGLINEKVEAFEDKVPFLGSLPLVGRLFRSEGERAVKRNLMMFVTAKKVEPTGRINSARSFE